MSESEMFFAPEPGHCQHDWRIEFTIDDERNGYYQARCTQCPQTASPDVMNGGVETLEAELAKSKGYEEGWRLQVEAAKLRLKALEAELAARDARCCATCLYRGSHEYVDEVQFYCIRGATKCAPNGFDEWVAKP